MTTNALRGVKRGRLPPLRVIKGLRAEVTRSFATRDCVFGRVSGHPCKEGFPLPPCNATPLVGRHYRRFTFLAPRAFDSSLHVATLFRVMSFKAHS